MKIILISIGPRLPNPGSDYSGCVWGSMVTLDYTGSEALLVGCNDAHGFYYSTIYNLTWANWGHGDHFQWETMPHELKYARAQTVVLMIPRSMTNCSLNKRNHPAFFQGTNSTFLEHSTTSANASLNLPQTLGNIQPSLRPYIQVSYYSFSYFNVG